MRFRIWRCGALCSKTWGSWRYTRRNGCSRRESKRHPLLLNQALTAETGASRVPHGLSPHAGTPATGIRLAPHRYDAVQCHAHPCSLPRPLSAAECVGHRRASGPNHGHRRSRARVSTSRWSGQPCNAGAGSEASRRGPAALGSQMGFCAAEPLPRAATMLRRIAAQRLVGRRGVIQWKAQMLFQR